MFIPLTMLFDKVGVEMQPGLGSSFHTRSRTPVANDHIDKLQETVHLVCSGRQHIENPGPQGTGNLFKFIWG